MTKTQGIYVIISRLFLLIAMISGITTIFDENGVVTEIPVSRTILLLHLLKQKLYMLHLLNKVTTTPIPFLGCICISYYLCNVNNTVIIDGAGVIDVRYRRCTSELEICCFLNQNNLTVTSTVSILVMNPATISIFLPTTVIMHQLSIMIQTSQELLYTIPANQQSPLSILTTQQSPFIISITQKPSFIILTTQQSLITIPSIFSVFTIPLIQQLQILTRTTQQIPFRISTIPIAISTNQLSVSTRLPMPLPTCLCIPIYQCATYINKYSSNSVHSTRIINLQQQFTNACIKSYTCCNFIRGSISTLPPKLTTLITNFSLTFSLNNDLAATLPIATISIVLSPSVYGQSCSCVLASTCIDGFISVFDASNIDPRLDLGRQDQPTGSCIGFNFVCCSLIQDNSLTTQINFNNILANEIKNYGTSNACRCVLITQCVEDNAVTYDEIGAIDPRFGPCASASMVCCRLKNRQLTDIIEITSV